MSREEGIVYSSIWAGLYTDIQFHKSRDIHPHPPPHLILLSLLRLRNRAEEIPVLLGGGGVKLENIWNKKAQINSVG